MSATPTGQPDKEGSDKNVGNPDTTLDELIDIYDGFITGGEPEIARHSFKASIEAYTAKAVREELERLKQEADTYLWSHATGQEIVRAVELYVIDAHIEQLKQEGGDNTCKHIRTYSMDSLPPQISCLDCGATL